MAKKGIIMSNYLIITEDKKTHKFKVVESFKGLTFYKLLHIKDYEVFKKWNENSVCNIEYRKNKNDEWKKLDINFILFYNEDYEYRVKE